MNIHKMLGQLESMRHKIASERGAMCRETIFHPDDGEPYPEHQRAIEAIEQAATALSKLSPSVPPRTTEQTGADSTSNQMQEKE